MNKDLRTFLKYLEEKRPDLLARVKKEVSQKFEIPVIQEKLAKQGRYPAVFCEKVEGSTMPIVSNLFGNYEMLGFGIGVEDKDLSKVLQTYMAKESNRIPVKYVDPKNAPVKEVIFKEDKADLSILPIPHHCPKDSGKYITIGCMIVQDPDNGVPNVGIYRHEVKGKYLLGAMLNPARDAAYIYRKFKERKLAMPVAIFIGHHPGVVIGASSRGGLEHNEFESMGGIMGEAIEVVKGETVDLPIPAYSEIVIEGVVQPGHEGTDGPFAEYAGYYGGQKKIPLIDVTAITMRKNPIFHDLDPAHREHNWSGLLPKEAQVFRRLKEIVPSINAVHLPASGTSVYHLYVRLKKEVEGQGKLTGLAAFAGFPDLKHVIVVDDDIDIFKDEEVLWAIATRVEADIDVSIIPFTLGAHLDPSAYGETRFNEGRMTTRMIIDATKPVTLPFAERIVPDKATWEKINLEEYLE